MANDVMVRKAVLDEIADKAYNEAVIDYDANVVVDQLVGARDTMGRISVEEGKTSKPMTYRAANLLTVGMTDPKWLAAEFDTQTPDYWATHWREEDEGTHPPMGPGGDFGIYDDRVTLRARGLLDFWAEVICGIEKDDVDEDHARRYYSGLYRALIEGNHSKMRIGVAPWAGKYSKDAIVLNGVPCWIHADDRNVREDEVEVNSAADW